jgi:hypothetical protein
MSDIQTSTRTEVTYELSRANEMYATQDSSLHSEKEDVADKYTYRDWREIPVKYVEARAHLLTNKAYGRESIMEVVAEEWEREDIFRPGSYKLREVKKTTTVETSDDQQGNTFRRETVADETTVFYTYFRSEEEFKDVTQKLAVKKAEWAAKDAERERIEAEVQSRVADELAKKGKKSKEDNYTVEYIAPLSSEAPKKTFWDVFLGR